MQEHRLTNIPSYRSCWSTRDRWLVVALWFCAWGWIACHQTPVSSLPSTSGVSSSSLFSSSAQLFGSGLRLWQQALREEPRLPALMMRSTQMFQQVASLRVLWPKDMQWITSLSRRQQRWLRVLLPSRHLSLVDNEEPMLRILVDDRGDGQVLGALGMKITSVSGTIKAGWLPLRSLSELSKFPTLREVALSSSLRLHTNVSGPMIQAPATRLQYGLDGRGVILGFIDTGIDYRHPAFQHSDGTSRILAILDFSLPSPVTQKPPHVFHQAQINEALRAGTPLAHKDTLGHGTHVAGIAAGNGQVSGQTYAPYVGIAPRADIVVVKGLRSESQEFDSGDVLQGVAFIHAFAKQRGKPYAINLSLGGQQGGHDGYSLLERALSTYSGPNKPGQIFVASAGNEGQSLIHAGGWLREGYPLRVELAMPTPSFSVKTTSSIVIEFWAATDSAIRMSVESPDGGRISSFAFHQPPTSPQELPGSFVTLTSGVQAQPAPGRNLAITISSKESKPFAAGTWVFRLEGQASRWDAWITESQVPGGGSVRWQTYHSQETLIGIPASADAVISVGSFNSRSGWQDASGDVQQRAFSPGQLSHFSSPGPTRDGRPKPELVAPGLFVVAPVSGWANPASSSLVASGLYQVSQGTSQAAPHVTGGMALLLQAQPQLDTEKIRHLLMRSSATDEFTSGSATYQKGWGFGKFDLLTALHTLKQPSNLSADPQTSKLGLLHETLPADGQSQTTVYIIPKDQQSVPIENTQQVELHSTLGHVSDVQKLASGLYRAVLTAPIEPGVASISARIDGVSLHTVRTLHFLSANQPPSMSGCQCQSDSMAPMSRLLYLTMIAFGFLFWCIGLRRPYLHKNP